MKSITIKSTQLLLIAFSLFGLSSCETDNEDAAVDVKTLVTDFKADELIKLHGGSSKSWRFKEVILPAAYEDYNTLPKTSCVADDVYVFNASATNESLEPVNILFGDKLCFSEISDSESFKAELLYTPYLVNNEEVIEVSLILEYSRYDEAENFTRTTIDTYQLTELTENRMVFSCCSEYVGEYSFAYVFEKL